MDPPQPAQTKDNIDSILRLSQRKLVVSKTDINLSKSLPNKIYILLVEESAGSAGGRAGGSGNRKISRIFGFSCSDGRCKNFFDTEKESKIEQFEIPYSAVAMDIVLSDGTPYVVQGIVDSEFIRSYDSIAELE